MRVEPATMDDLDRLADAWVALAEEQRAYGSHLGGDANREAMRMAFAAAIVEDRVLVARESGTDRVVGFVQFEVESGSLARAVDRGVVQNVYVEPGARDEGVGSALLRAAEERLDDAGVDVVALEAMAKNERARRLYRRRGYRPHRIEYERPLQSDTHSKEDR